MQKLLQILILVILSLISQQSSAESDPYLDHSRSEWVALTATTEGRVRVTITKQKPKLRLAKTQRPVVQLIRLSADDDSDYYNELPDLQVGYRRPELIDQTAKVDNDISDEIKIRLVLARMRALEAYTKKWA
jgi:hypothetical protein